MPAQQDIDALFAEIDKDGSGTLDSSELFRLYEMNGVTDVHIQVNETLYVYDKTHNGSLDKDEFV